MDISLVLLAAGSGSRMKMTAKKQWLRSGQDPFWLVVARNFKSFYEFDKIIIVGSKNEIEYMSEFECGFEFVAGGKERQISLKNALESVNSKFVMVSDVARVGVTKELTLRLIENCDKFDCVSPYLSVSDTAYLGENLLNRSKLKLIQTPQISKLSLLKKALESDEIFTDDSSAIKSVGGKLGFVEGDIRAFKVTTKSDLLKLNLPAPSGECLSGNGYDVHKFQSGDGLIICGEKIPCEYSFVAHSDGDVGLHALIDALLGACGLGDIGEFYPDTDLAFKGANSAELLKNTLKIINGYGYEVVNADITILAQTPKISPYKAKMKQNLAEILGTKRVNVKATTTEGLGFVGKKEGIAAIATVNLRYFDWTKV